MYALNLNEEKRVLSVCRVLPNGSYDGMPIVDTLPKGNIADYLYENGEYVFSPLPVEPVKETVTEAQRLEALELAMAELAAEVYNG